MDSFVVFEKKRTKQDSLQPPSEVTKAVKENRSNYHSQESKSFKLNADYSLVITKFLFAAEPSHEKSKSSPNSSSNSFLRLARLAEGVSALGTGPSPYSTSYKAMYHVYHRTLEMFFRPRPQKINPIEPTPIYADYPNPTYFRRKPGQPPPPPPGLTTQEELWRVLQCNSHKPKPDIRGGPLVMIEDKFFEYKVDVCPMTSTIYLREQYSAKSSHCSGNLCLKLKSEFILSTDVVDHGAHIVSTPASVPDFLDLEVEYSRKSCLPFSKGSTKWPSGIMVLWLTIELQELTSCMACEEGSFSFKEPNKELRTMMLLDRHDITGVDFKWLNKTKGSWKISHDSYTCMLPELGPTFFSERLMRSYGIKITVGVRTKEETVIELSSFMEISVGKIACMEIAKDSFKQRYFYILTPLQLALSVNAKIDRWVGNRPWTYPRMLLDDFLRLSIKFPIRLDQPFSEQYIHLKVMRIRVVLLVLWGRYEVCPVKQRVSQNLWIVQGEEHLSEYSDIRIQPNSAFPISYLFEDMRLTYARGNFAFRSPPTGFALLVSLAYLDKTESKLHFLQDTLPIHVEDHTLYRGIS
ncbi:hypothetical protein FT663_03435 [Candidozyma haemuli var. vulneris]|nr:hypothetical protein FT663_03435 [[Candida] haemuloni var. vulneris]KAF3991392.1 hypothetical protein FT662_01747 [[Candida] haemuloni var. vulneris]